MLQEVYHATQYFPKQLKLKHKLPYFVVDFNGGYSDLITYVSQGMNFMAGNVFIPGVESLHFISEGDSFSYHRRNSRKYEKPITVEHD